MVFTADSAAPAVAPAGRARLFLADGNVQANPGMQELNAVMDQLAPFWLDLADLSDEMADWLRKGDRCGRCEFPRRPGRSALHHLRTLTELASYRSMLTPLHKVLIPQTNIFATLSSGSVRVPGAGDDRLPYLRDIYDHLKKLSDLTDSYRDQISGAASSYSSVVSNQLNAVMKQLAIISTVFLPLTFLTGFFGQNFGALIGHIGSWPAFLILGIGSEVLAVGWLYLLFRRRDWLKS
jgi:Mg2+ and Co2+ transporter CorA